MEINKSTFESAPLPVAVAASFAIERFAGMLEAAACHSVGLPASIVSCPYGGVDGWLQQAHSPWNTSRATILLLRPEDVVYAHPELRLGSSPLDPDRLLALPGPELWSAAYGGIIRLLDAAAMRSSAPCLLLLMPSPHTWHADAGARSAVAALVRKVTAYVASNVSVWMRSNVTVAGPERLLQLTGAGGSAYYSAAADLAVHDPYSAAFTASLVTVTCRWLHMALSGSSGGSGVKAVALDCDNTLWLGAIGELGAEGIVVSPPFQHLQRFMAGLRRRGVLLCLVSKNVESDVRSAFTGRARDMPLRLDTDIVAMEVHWNRKSESIKRLAEKLQIGVDSFVFVDDNPLECAEVAAACPSVTVVALPADPQQFPDFLDNCWVFDTPATIAEWLASTDSVESDGDAGSSSTTASGSAGDGAEAADGGAGGAGGGTGGSTGGSTGGTEEDRMRTQLYKDQQARVEDRKTYATYAAFIASLGLHIDIEHVCDATLARAAQLTVRTNQLNAHKAPYSEAELLAASRSTHDVYTVYVADRFGAYGLVGVMLLRKEPYCPAAADGSSSGAADRQLHVDSFLLSCRVLNRGVEHAMLRHCAAVAAGAGCTALRIRWVPSDRNEPMRAFLWSLPAIQHVPDGARSVEEELAEAREVLAQFVADARASGDAAVLAALAPPANPPRDRDRDRGDAAAPRRPCRFGIKCTRLGLDEQHMQQFTHDFLWDAGHGLAHRGLSDVQAAQLLRAKLVVAKTRPDRPFLGSLPPGATPVTAKPPAGYVVIPVASAAEAAMDTSGIDASASAAAASATADAASTAVTTGGAAENTRRGWISGGCLRLHSETYCSLASAWQWRSSRDSRDSGAERLACLRAAATAASSAASSRSSSLPADVWEDYDAVGSSTSGGADGDGSGSAARALSAHEAACRARRKMRQQVKEER